MSLLVDIGNSRLKWAFLMDTDFSISHALFHTADNFDSELAEQWRAVVFRPKKIVIGNVANKVIYNQITLLAKSLWPDIKLVQVKSTANAFNVTSAYNQPEKLGVDRWLALVAVHQYYKSAACIVDCGSAITLDIIDQQGVHQGGLIAPGINMMKQSLVDNTETLPLVSEDFPLALANKTDAAIYSGIMFLIIGMINKVLTQQKNPTKLILTGGDAECIAKHLDQEFVIDNDLVLKGLMVFAKGE